MARGLDGDRSALDAGSSVLDLLRRCRFSWLQLLALHSFRYVRWSASLLALLFLIIVATVNLPNLSKHAHERVF